MFHLCPQDALELLLNAGVSISVSTIRPAEQSLAREDCEPGVFEAIMKYFPFLEGQQVQIGAEGPQIKNVRVYFQYCTEESHNLIIWCSTYYRPDYNSARAR